MGEHSSVQNRAIHEMCFSFLPEEKKSTPQKNGNKTFPLQKGCDSSAATTPHPQPSKHFLHSRLSTHCIGGSSCAAPW